jgi:hypothetical protein
MANVAVEALQRAGADGVRDRVAAGLDGRIRGDRLGELGEGDLRALAVGEVAEGLEIAGAVVRAAIGELCRIRLERVAL